MFAFLVLLISYAASSFGLYSPASLNTTELTKENYHTILSRNNDLWMILGYVPSCESCEKFAADFEQLVKGVQGILKVGTVNIEEQPELKKELKLDTEPTLKFVDTIIPTSKTFKGDLATDKIIDYILKLVRQKIERQAGIFKSKHSEARVIELNDDTFDKNVFKSETPWLVEFYAPWCSHCKKFGPIYTQIAKELKQEVKCGAVDATNNKELAQRFDIQFFPTLKFFSANINGKAYDGHNSKDGVIEWVREIVYSLPTNVTQITDEETLKAACEKTTLCVIAFLPNILDCEASCRHEYLNTTVQAAEKFAGNRWGWVWTEGGVQDGIEKALDVGGSGYPTMVVVNIKKMKYAYLKGPYSVKGIQEFLSDIASGKWEAVPIKETEMPKIHTVTPWDGTNPTHLPLLEDGEEEMMVKPEEETDASIKDEL